MGEFLEQLRASRSEPTAITQRFRLEYNAATENIYLFFESVDDWRFYHSAIESHVRENSKINVYYCGNKKGVWLAYNFAEGRDSLKNVLCFVDKDLDDYCGTMIPEKARIFVTEFYSIENYLCTPATLKKFLELVVGLSNDLSATKSLLEKFEESLQMFHRAMLPVFAWAIASRCMGATVQFGSVGPSLDNCFDKDDLGVRAKVALVDYFNERCAKGCESVAGEPEIIEWAETLKRREPKTWLRGKYELWFTLAFMNGAWDGLAGGLLTDRRKIKKDVHLTPENAFSILGDKAPIPSGLAEFLQHNIAAC